MGAGKSSILLAIEFALFGIRRGELSGEALLRRGRSRGSVKLTFTVGGKEVTIERNLKATPSGIRQDEGYINIEGVRRECTPTELKARVLELLGYPQELLHKQKSLIFRYTVYTPQEQMKQIIHEDKEQRLETLRKVFGVDRYKIMQDNISNFLRELRRKKRELEIIFRELDEKDKDRKGKKEELDKAGKQLESLFQKREELTKIIEQLEQNLKKINKKIELYNTIDKNIAKYNEAMNQIKKQKLDIENRIIKNKEKISQIDEMKKPTEKTEDELNSKIEEIDKQKEDYLKNPKGINEFIDSLIERQAETEQSLNDIKERIQKLTPIKITLSEALSKLEAIEGLGISLERKRLFGETIEELRDMGEAVEEWGRIQEGLIRLPSEPWQMDGYEIPDTSSFDLSLFPRRDDVVEYISAIIECKGMVEDCKKRLQDFKIETKKDLGQEIEDREALLSQLEEPMEPPEDALQALICPPPQQGRWPIVSVSLDDYDEKLARVNRTTRIHRDKEMEKEEWDEKVKEKIGKIKEEIEKLETISQILDKTQEQLTELNKNKSMLDEKKTFLENEIGKLNDTIQETKAVWMKRASILYDRFKLGEMRLRFDQETYNDDISALIRAMNQGQRTLLQDLEEILAPFPEHLTRARERFTAENLSQILEDLGKQEKTSMLKQNEIQKEVEKLSKEIQINVDVIIDNMNEEKRKLQALLEKMREYKSKLEEKEGLLKDIQESESKLAELENERLEVLGEIRKMKEGLEALGDVHKQRDEIERSLGNVRDELGDLKGEIGKWQENEKNLKHRIEELTKEIDGMRKAERFHKDLISYEDWLERYLLELTGTMERHFMHQLKTRFDPLFRDWFSILIEDDLLNVRIDPEFTPIIEQEGYTAEYENLSGGESAAVALAYRLALNKVINTLIPEIKTRDLIILDEPTDGFSDKQLDKIRDIINQLKVPQTIIVSHEPKIGSYVENILQVNKERGSSTVQEIRI